jgi:sulfite oxidase
LNCDVLEPTDGDHVAAGRLTIRGYALAGDGREIARVDVSVDDGASWRQAGLETSANPWTWRFWSLSVDIEPGPLTVTVRAWDDTGATQPESAASLWNSRRVCQQLLGPDRTDR